MIKLATLLLALALLLPPQLPSSFWGYAIGCKVGDRVEARISEEVLAYSTIMEYQGSPVYTLDVVGGTHNALVSFYVDKKLAGTGNWISGTNQRVDIRCSYKDQQKRNYKFWMPHIYGGD